MVDAAYYRRQAATCRALAGNSTQNECGWRDLAEHFERLAMALEAKRQGGNRDTRPTNERWEHIETLNLCGLCSGGMRGSAGAPAMIPVIFARHATAAVISAAIVVAAAPAATMAQAAKSPTATATDAAATWAGFGAAQQPFRTARHRPLPAERGHDLFGCRHRSGRRRRPDAAAGDEAGGCR